MIPVYTKKFKDTGRILLTPENQSAVISSVSKKKSNIFLLFEVRILIITQDGNY